MCQEKSTSSYSVTARSSHYCFGFWLVVFVVDRFPHIAILTAIALAAIVQIVVQLHYFLHLDRTSDQSWNLLAIVFTVLIIAIMLLGTLWIIFDLHTRMM